MNNPIVRKLVATLAGLVAAFVIVGIVEAAGHAMWPPPAGLDVTNPADQARLMDSIPAAAKAMVLVAWFLGVLSGAMVAIKLGHQMMPAWIVGAVLIALSLWTTTLFPHPWWMVAGAVVLPIIAVLLAQRLIAGRAAA